MRIWISILAMCLGLAAPSVNGQAPVPAMPPPSSSSSSGGAQLVDRIAVRIEDDIITESQVRELAAFQQLTEDKPQPREEVVQHLIEQWIVRTEAATARYPRASEDQVARNFDRLTKQFHSLDAFRARLAALGLSEAAVRRLLGDELYLSGFLDYKFRPAAQVDQTQIEAYYKDTLAPELAAKGQQAPPLADAAEQIRELLTQRDINERATRWLEETKSRLRIDIAPGDSGP
jgi:peptidyl-prolyl cis-trans isomerase SurA